MTEAFDLIADRVGHGHNGCKSDVTRILSQIELGDPQAAEQLLPLVYDELRKLAAAKLAQENPGQTLQAMSVSSVVVNGHLPAAAHEVCRLRYFTPS